MATMWAVLMIQLCEDTLTFILLPELGDLDKMPYLHPVRSQNPSLITVL